MPQSHFSSATMTSDLYDILDVPRDATPEQIRKAYRKKALQTHPDRLPQGASEEDKATSAEQFRRVNNAYEVLSNPENRKQYDHHGEWPPPEHEDFSPRSNSSHRHWPHGSDHHAPSMDSFSDPFFTPFQHNTFGGDSHAHPHFGFTDPFILFDSIFGDGYIPRMHHFHHHDPYAHLHRGQPAFPYSDHRFREMNDFMDGSLLGPRAHPHMLPFPVIPRNHGPSSSVYHSQSVSYSGGVQESHMTSTVNGVTHKVWSRRDADGNEHVTHTYPDGREAHTVNGVEQMSPAHRSNRYLPSGRQPSFGVQHRHRPTPMHYARPPSPPLYAPRSSPSEHDHSYPEPFSKRKWWNGW